MGVTVHFYKIFQFKEDVRSHYLETLLLPWQPNVQIYTYHSWTFDMFLDSNQST